MMFILAPIEKELEHAVCLVDKLRELIKGEELRPSFQELLVFFIERHRFQARHFVHFLGQIFHDLQHSAVCIFRDACFEVFLLLVQT